MKSRLNHLVLAATLCVAGCVGPLDVASRVQDLRVLGSSLEKPELMARACGPLTPQTLAIYSAEVTYKALIADPQGNGRTLHYQLYGCTSLTDRTCSNPGESVLLAEGDTTAGEISLQIRPGQARREDGTPLVQAVQQASDVKGLGGIRMPLVLHLVGGTEEIYAQKLMVFNCPYFPDMKANQNPVLPGITLNDTLLNSDDFPTVQGPGPYVFKAVDFSDQEESYVVPSYDLQRVELKESWIISWFTDLGLFGADKTGGTTAAVESPSTNTWYPTQAAAVGEKDVTFWFVIRDGRGGTSWLTRRLHHYPAPNAPN